MTLLGSSPRPPDETGPRTVVDKGNVDHVDNGDREATRALERTLGETQDRLQLLIEQVIDYAIIGLDARGVIELWNSGATRLKGYTEAEAKGRHHSIFYTEEDQADRLPERLLAQARSHGSVQHLGWRVRADGTKFWADVTLTAVHDHEGQHTGFAKVTRDLTDLHELEQNRASFLSALAHDFRGPLTAIDGYASLLEQSDVDPAVALSRIRLNTERLDQMIADVLESVRSPVGLPAPTGTEPTDVLALARRAIDNLGATAGVDRVVVGDTTAMAMAGPAALERVVINLVMNAARYSTQGSIRVDARPRGPWMLLTVSDHGRGIAPEDLPVITEPYRRGRLAGDDGGIGLGLSSVRILVEQQGGVLEIDSEVDVGTTVTVALRAAP